MALIHGFATHAAGAELLPYKYDPGDIRQNEVEIAITHCGICRNDIHMVDNDWGISQYPLIPGHEIVGKVMGTVHRNGGYAERVRVNARFVVAIPEGMDSERTAPLLCGGVTVYNPIRTHGINPASRVGIVGIGGLGHMALQFAHAFGAEVTAFSTSPAKEADARSLGAEHFVNTRETKTLKKLAGYFDFILSTIEGEQDWNAYIAALRPQGTLCFVGVPPGVLSVPIFPLASGQKVITGSPIGSPRMIREMLDVASRHKVQAITERFAMAKANDAVTKVKRNQVRYRAVLAN
jgi:alcohol/geraniol dehydrogenase (NADP+)